MPAPVNIVGTKATAVTDGGASETVVLTCNPVITDSTQKTVHGIGFLVITPGTSAVACVIKIRRSTVSGTQVGTTQSPITVATDVITIPFGFIDTPGDSSGLVYVVTVTETTAGANGTVGYVQLHCFVTE
jgi:hypothetical protein